MPHYPDDITLWTAFQRGENRAETELFEKYFRPVCLFAERFTGRLHPAEDIAIEHIHKVWARRQEFASVENARAFLFRSVRNAGINYAKAEKNHEAIQARIAYLLRDDADAPDVLQREILRVELLHEIYREIDNLPDRCGQVFRLLFLHQRTIPEVARELGIREHTARLQKARAIRLLRTELLKKHRLDTLLLFYCLLENI